MEVEGEGWEGNGWTGRSVCVNLSVFPPLSLHRSASLLFVCCMVLLFRLSFHPFQIRETKYLDSMGVRESLYLHLNIPPQTRLKIDTAMRIATNIALQEEKYIEYGLCCLSVLAPSFPKAIMHHHEDILSILRPVLLPFLRFLSGCQSVLLS